LSSNPETSKKTIISPVDQKAIIHTLVDLLNSMLEINTQKNKNFLYEMFASRFFSKLNQVYSGSAAKELLDRLDNSIKKKITVSSDKKIHYKISKNIVNNQGVTLYQSSENELYISHQFRLPVIITIIDALGRELIQNTYHDNEITLSLHGFVSGLYSLIFWDGSNISTSVFIKR
jgi:hypothetical protein